MSIDKSLEYIGKRFNTNRCGVVEVVDYLDYKNILVKFNDGTLKYVRSGDLKNGEVRNPNHPNLLSVGFEGVGKHQLNSDVGVIWKAMITRCYSEYYQNRKPTYVGCKVDEHWFNFQNFAAWCESREDYKKGFQLDKDLLVLGNKEYSQTTCCFLPREINSAINTLKPKRGSQLPLGVVVASNGKYRGQCCVNGVQEFSDVVMSQTEAFLWYKRKKEGFVKELANKWRYSIDEKAYNALYKFEVGFEGRVR